MSNKSPMQPTSGHPPATGGEPQASVRAGGARGFAIEHRITIQATPEKIWALLGDMEGWGRWNPLHPKMSAAPPVGGTLTATIAIPGMKPNEFSAVLSDWVPNARLNWQVSNAGGLIRMTRYVEIVPVTDQSCIVINGELFGGLLGPLLGRALKARVQQGYQMMSDALKATAEAR